MQDNERKSRKCETHHGVQALLPRPPHARGGVDEVEVAVHQLLQARRVLVRQVAQRLRGGAGGRPVCIHAGILLA